MNWTIDEYNCYTLKVPIKFRDDPTAHYRIIIQARPAYCDRGDWMIHIDGYNDVDYSDGFPRYFFGSWDEVKRQMETWLNRREAYRLTLK
jgi:hypothetical protein